MQRNSNRAWDDSYSDHRPRTQCGIDDLLACLIEEKARGVTRIVLEGRGTLMCEGDNSVILTTEPQI